MNNDENEALILDNRSNYIEIKDVPSGASCYHGMMAPSLEPRINDYWNHKNNTCAWGAYVNVPNHDYLGDPKSVGFTMAHEFGHALTSKGRWIIGDVVSYQNASFHDDSEPNLMSAGPESGGNLPEDRNESLTPLVKYLICHFLLCGECDYKNKILYIMITRIRYFILISVVVLTRCTQPQSNEQINHAKHSNDVDFECKLVDTFFLNNKTIKSKTYKFLVMNNSIDTVFFNASKSDIKMHSWNYYFYYQDTLVYDSIEYCNHFSDYKYPILPNSRDTFIKTLLSPFVSDEFWVKYKKNKSILKRKVICKE